MRLLIELAEEGDGRWRAGIPDLAGLTVYAASEDGARHLAIAEALSQVDDPNGICFVSGDREWVVQSPAEPDSRQVARPTTIEEVVEAVKRWPQLRIVGAGTNSTWSVRAGGEGPLEDPMPQLELRRLKGVIQHDVSDQVVSVRAGTTLSDLNRALAEEGQCIPLGDWPVDKPSGSIGGAIALNLPHPLEGQTGSWREWILGLTLVTASGEVVKCGSRAVKNVAGYDVQKLLLGARGTLGVVVEVILRTFPVKALPEPKVIVKGAPHAFRLVVHRVLPTDFSAAFAQYEIAVGEPATGTIWANLEPAQDPVRFPGDWVLRELCGPRNLELADPVSIRFMQRAKDLFDPSHRLNPGEMGIF